MTDKDDGFKPTYEAILKTTVGVLFLVLQSVLGFIAWSVSQEITTLRQDVGKLNASMAALVVQMTTISDNRADIKALRFDHHQHTTSPHYHESVRRDVERLKDDVRTILQKLENVPSPLPQKP
jgi:uncharacterized coiled-coil protein SlyX